MRVQRARCTCGAVACFAVLWAAQAITVRGPEGEGRRHVAVGGLVSWGASHEDQEEVASTPSGPSAKPLCPDLWGCVGNFWLRRGEHGKSQAAWAQPVALSQLRQPNTSRTPVYTWLHFMLRGYSTPVMADQPFAKYLNEYNEGRLKKEFIQRGGKVTEVHDQQTAASARSFRTQHSQMVLFGEIEPIELVMRLAYTHDPTDLRVGVGSQWLHMLQFFHVMKLDGVTDRELLFACVIHDLGKLGSLVDGDELSDGCSTGLDYQEVPDGAGMEALTIPFDHHDFGADKLRRYVSPRVYRLLRYHCFRDIMMEEKSAELHRIMTPEERLQKSEVQQFFQYDQLSKSMWFMPRVDIAEIRDLLHEFLPPRIVF